MAPIWLAVSMVLVLAAHAGPGGGGTVTTETLWGGVFRGDSLFLRAAWIPTVGESTCIATMFADDTLITRPKYLDYRVDDARGETRYRDTVSGDEFFCCDALVATGTAWRGGLVLQVTATGWGCEPAGDCENRRFVYLAGRDTTAVSDWTDVEWDPKADSLTATMVSVGCVEYAMPARPSVRGTRFEFEPLLPAGAREGDLIEKPVDSYCSPSWGDRDSLTIDVLPTSEATVPETLVVGPKTRIDVTSIVLRLERGARGGLTARVYRVRIAASGRSGYVTPAFMKDMGFGGF